MTKAERPFTGRHMAMIMVAFFGVVIAVNVTMAVLANRSWTGLVVKNSYVASQSFDKDTAALEAAEALGVAPRFGYEDGIFTLELLDKSGAVTGTYDVSVKLGRATHEGEDRVLKLTSLGQGRFSASTELGQGLWRGEVSAKVGTGEIWRQPIELLVK